MNLGAWRNSLTSAPGRLLSDDFTGPRGRKQSRLTHRPRNTESQLIVTWDGLHLLLGRQAGAAGRGAESWAGLRKTAQRRFKSLSDLNSTRLSGIMAVPALHPIARYTGQWGYRKLDLLTGVSDGG